MKERYRMIIEYSESARDTIEPLMENLRFLGSIGASRRLIVSNGDLKKDRQDDKYFFDGDGSDKIYDIKIHKISYIPTEQKVNNER